MKYMGSKARFVKELLPIILRNRKHGQWYIEPFCGGCNMICEVSGNRIASDLHPYLISMWKAVVYDGFEPDFIERDVYNDIRLNKENYPPPLVGWAGFNCAYRGIWFGGYAGQTHTKIGTTRNYQNEAILNIKKQIPKLKGVEFYNLPYNQVPVPPNSIIYCDPPYYNTAKYKTGEEFNHTEFWQWCRMMSINGHSVYISEYSAPQEFKCIWSKQVSSQLSANGKSGGSKISIEKLFVFSETYNEPLNNNFF